MVEAILEKVKFIPLGERVLVLPDKDQKRKGGIIIPDTAKEKPQVGKVISVGKGKVSEEGKILPMEVKTGDRVLFGKYSGSEIKIDGLDHIIMEQGDILGIVD